MAIPTDVQQAVDTWFTKLDTATASAAQAEDDAATAAQSAMTAQQEQADADAAYNAMLQLLQDYHSTGSGGSSAPPLPPPPAAGPQTRPTPTLPQEQQRSTRSPGRR